MQEWQTSILDDGHSAGSPGGDVEADGTVDARADERHLGNARARDLVRVVALAEGGDVL